MLLVENGADVDVAADDGSTPLDLALLRQHSECVEYLKEVGAKSANKTEVRGVSLWSPSPPRPPPPPPLLLFLLLFLILSSSPSPLLLKSAH